MKIALHVVCKEGAVNLSRSHGNDQRITVPFEKVLKYIVSLHI